MRGVAGERQDEHDRRAEQVQLIDVTLVLGDLRLPEVIVLLLPVALLAQVVEALARAVKLSLGLAVRRLRRGSAGMLRARRRPHVLARRVRRPAFVRVVRPVVVIPRLHVVGIELGQPLLGARGVTSGVGEHRLERTGEDDGDEVREEEADERAEQRREQLGQQRPRLVRHRAVPSGAAADAQGLCRCAPAAPGCCSR